MGEEVAAQVFRLYQKRGKMDYLGEMISQEEHAIQCAMLAEKAGATTETILGALLHDIGHLLETGRVQNMVTGDTTLGQQEHEHLGSQFLASLGVPATVTDIVRGHVDAKRYLCFKHATYQEGLSAASKMTLTHQGGPMTPDEATAFEKQPRFELIVLARQWDDQGKVANLPIDPLQKYEHMFRHFMDNVLQTPSTTAAGSQQ